MRKLPNESIEQWANRVQTFELEFALKEIRKGADINLVMEAMSARIQKKILHPFYEEIRKQTTDAAKESAIISRQKYEEQYLSKNKPKSDHVIEDK
jgi:glutamyl-tRNA reductase